MTAVAIAVFAHFVNLKDGLQQCSSEAENWVADVAPEHWNIPTIGIQLQIRSCVKW